jgi:hypothetical protein
MKRHLASNLILIVVSTLGCSGSSGNSGSSSSSGDESWANVHPPASIDIKSCYSIVDDSSDSVWDECGACCSTNGFSASGFINQDHCTCGKSEEMACPTKVTTGDECSTCCQDRGYEIHMWASLGTTTSCTCAGKSDSQICAIALTRKDPSDQCGLCCLNNGFLASQYSAIGTPDCTCVAP